ncbi:uncharacterized protein E0L32_000881 [Thyridium curvatum]|uniref:Uncharacterized protein n=1 Tax=Thyridium curvatum TaxID=1093900 RepID=A0A507B1X5_9PEZI|nr:uncharacterized protein E0L32_000881 [Thyridium curvatum]TPX12704.1 hypothetical protein E0L32_000881 [Thyridium curvatum]
MQRLARFTTTSPSPAMLARRAAARAVAQQQRQFGITAAYRAGPADQAVPPTEHTPNPTESEEDVSADRSPVEPLHKPRPTESEEDVKADRSTEDPIHPKGTGRPVAEKH